MKITQTKTLFAWLLLFVSTTLPLIIEEITDEEATEDNRSPENNSNINEKSSKKPPQSDSRSTPEKMGKSAHRTKTEPPEWKKVRTPQMTYFFYQNRRNNELNPPGLEKIFDLIFSDIAEKSMAPHHYEINIPLKIPIDKGRLSTTKPSLADKNCTDKPSEHNDMLSMIATYRKINRSLIESLGIASLIPFPF